MPWFHKPSELSEVDQTDRLEQAIRNCEVRLAADGRRNPERGGMGTTLTMAFVVWPTMRLLHIGDSRCYRFRQNQLTQLTVDHTLAQKMIERQFSPTDIPERWYHMLWNAVSGSDSDAQPSVQLFDLMLGDTLLLCTDGLTAHVEDYEIAHMLACGLNAEQICEQLVRQANDRGGTDNITTVVARFVEAGQFTSQTREDAVLQSNIESAAPVDYRPTEDDRPDQAVVSSEP